MDLEADFYAFKEAHRPFLVKARMEEFLNMLSTLSLNDEKEKFVSGRSAYGGTFNPFTIRHEVEMREEVLDFANYVDMKWFVEHKQDSNSFQEYVSQYMQ